ncbi:MAG: Eco29kI family restriction endonuclease [Anaerolineae bacterium]|nr:Eco29kI family restriction endonuclease [Anaerolineae bacterium]
MPISPEQHQFRSPLFESVVKQALQFFQSTPLQPLPPDEVFSGVGVYAIYLLAHDSIYSSIAEPTATRPIYVGKAVPAGWRTARVRDLSRSTELFNRIREHSRRIVQAENLNVAQFRSRFMILNEIESDLIVPVEAELIRAYKPLWNTKIDGFGNHDPGSGRYNQALSEWDALHPGRSWATRLIGAKPDISLILAKIQKHIEDAGT